MQASLHARLGMVLVLALSSTSAIAASYKCKDGSGNWSEQACPDYQARQKQAADAAAQELAIREWAPRVGMRTNEVSKVVDDPQCHKKTSTMVSLRWCGCLHVNRTQNSRGLHEQWVFGCGGLRSYLYFDNGILSSIQE